MKVKLLVGRCGPDIVQAPGDVIDCEGREAFALCDGGSGEPADDETRKAYDTFRAARAKEQAAAEKDRLEKVAEVDAEAGTSPRGRRKKKETLKAKRRKRAHEDEPDRTN